MTQSNAILQGKTALVTGGTSGIGLETAKGLAKLGAEVVIVGRDAAKTAGVVEQLRRETGNDNIHSLLADLSSQTEVRSLARKFLDAYPHLHILVNNAGAMFDKRTETVDGIEMTWALNHLAYFLLTELLLDRLKADAPSRIVNVASEAHRSARTLHLDDPGYKSGYKTFQVYSHSKLANILFTRELARRLAGTGVTANSLHPGFVNTSFFLNKGRLGWLLKQLARVFSIDPQNGAKTSIHLAGSPEVEGRSGLYFDKCKVRKPNSAASNDTTARALWDLSTQQTR